MQPYDVKAIPIVVYDRENRMNKKNITVLVLASLTMIAFSTFEYTLKWLFGDIAMVAMVYIAIMFGSGLLTEVPLPLLRYFDQRTNRPTARLQFAVLAHSVSVGRGKHSRESSGVVRIAGNHRRQCHKPLVSSLLPYLSMTLSNSLPSLASAGIPTDDPWFALVCFFFFALVVATFVSHTVASMILMPLVTQIGVNLQTPKMMVFGSALAGLTSILFSL
jgi:di/tricarboxylate transporter